MKTILRSILAFILVSTLLFQPFLTAQSAQASATTLRLTHYTGLSAYSVTGRNLHRTKAENKPYYSATQKSILIGDTYTLDLFDVPEDSEITIKSSDTSILEVNQTSNTTCEYTGIAAGDAKIVIHIKQPGFLFMGKKQNLTCNIHVSPRAVSIKFRQANYKLSSGKTKKLSVILRPIITTEKPTFESSNPKIATVTPAGKVRARSIGMCYITAKISNGKSARCKIIIKPKKNI